MWATPEPSAAVLPVSRHLLLLAFRALTTARHPISTPPRVHEWTQRCCPRRVCRATGECEAKTAGNSPGYSRTLKTRKLEHFCLDQVDIPPTFGAYLAVCKGNGDDEIVFSLVWLLGGQGIRCRVISSSCLQMGHSSSLLGERTNVVNTPHQKLSEANDNTSSSLELKGKVWKKKRKEKWRSRGSLVRGCGVNRVPNQTSTMSVLMPPLIYHQRQHSSKFQQWHHSAKLVWTWQIPQLIQVLFWIHSVTLKPP